GRPDPARAGVGTAASLKPASRVSDAGPPRDRPAPRVAPARHSPDFRGPDATGVEPVRTTPAQSCPRPRVDPWPGRRRHAGGDASRYSPSAGATATVAQVCRLLPTPPSPSHRFHFPLSRLVRNPPLRRT